MSARDFPKNRLNPHYRPYFLIEGESVMSNVKEIDYVLQSVRHAARQFGLASDGTLGQQILLLGDSFYGYRFTMKEFTAVWSASDQTLKVFDRDGRCLGNTLLNMPVEKREEESISLHFAEEYPQRKVA